MSQPTRTPLAPRSISPAIIASTVAARAQRLAGVVLGPKRWPGEPEPEDMAAEGKGRQPTTTHAGLRRALHASGPVRPPRFDTMAISSPSMPWIKVPAENHAIFLAALPKDPRVETLKMFGGIAAKVNDHIFAGLFGRSTMLLLAEPDRAEALALEGATLFDPMGNGRVRSDKVMLPESIMTQPAELRRWIARAFKAAATLPDKPAKASSTKSAPKPAAPIVKGAVENRPRAAGAKAQKKRAAR